MTLLGNGATLEVLVNIDTSSGRKKEAYFRDSDTCYGEEERERERERDAHTTKKKFRR